MAHGTLVVGVVDDSSTNLAPRGAPRRLKNRQMEMAKELNDSVSGLIVRGTKCCFLYLVLFCVMVLLTGITNLVCYIFA